jgi:UDP-N-acetylglucosamine/UDP-N-acetyl-alpha-D-glucosaminouronate 4-epimerase
MRALVTGGAGFIGSHLIDALVERGADVVVLDDLSSGRAENVNRAARLIEADILDKSSVDKAMEGCELVFHQAARRAVLQSIEQPLETDRVNVGGTLTVLMAARDAGVRRVVFGASSSVYGGSATLPTPESVPANPRSPYAVTKYAGEQYCRVFGELYGLETVALRYFNVYGPRQRPDSRYAAVIPLFIGALAAARPPEVHGDGLQSRHFTFVSDAVRANLRAAEAGPQCSGRVCLHASRHTSDPRGDARCASRARAHGTPNRRCSPQPCRSHGRERRARVRARRRASPWAPAHRRIVHEGDDDARRGGGQ